MFVGAPAPSSRRLSRSLAGGGGGGDDGLIIISGLLRSFPHKKLTLFFSCTWHRSTMTLAPPPVRYSKNLPPPGKFPPVTPHLQSIVFGPLHLASLRSLSPSSFSLPFFLLAFNGGSNRHRLKWGQTVFYPRPFFLSSNSVFVHRSSNRKRRCQEWTQIVRPTPFRSYFLLKLFFRLFISGKGSLHPFLSSPLFV